MMDRLIIDKFGDLICSCGVSGFTVTMRPEREVNCWTVDQLTCNSCGTIYNAEAIRRPTEKPADALTRS